MPVIVTTPEPYPYQRKTMEALGFSLSPTEGDLCAWTFTAIGGGTGLPPYNLVIHMRQDQEPDLQQATALIIRTGLETGARRRADAIKALLA